MMDLYWRPFGGIKIFFAEVSKSKMHKPCLSACQIPTRRGYVWGLSSVSPVNGEKTVDRNYFVCGFFPASTSVSPFPLENIGLSIVPPMRNGNCSLPFTNEAPENRATVFVKNPSLVVISARPR
jgi:hypothetical protein